MQQLISASPTSFDQQTGKSDWVCSPGHSWAQLVLRLNDTTPTSDKLEVADRINVSVLCIGYLMALLDYLWQGADE